MIKNTKVIEDLKARSLSIAVLIGQHEDGSLQVIRYGEHGRVEYISRFLNMVELLEPLPDGTLRGITTIKGEP